MYRRPDKVFSGYAVDLDGTVMIGDNPVPGAISALGRARWAGAKLVYISDSTLQSPSAIAESLRGWGVWATADQIITPLGLLTGYLKARHPGAAALTVAEPAVDELLLAARIEVTAEPSATGVVVVSSDRSFDYDKLLRAFQAVRQYGAAIVAINRDPFCPTTDGEQPGGGAVLAAIEVSTGTRAEAVLGKPGPQMAGAVLAKLGVGPETAAVVGDSVGTDMALARALRMTGILVLTGVTSRDEVRGAALRPDYVIDAIGQLLPGFEANDLEPGTPPALLARYARPEPLARPELPAGAGAAS
jgi:NagD protein